MGGIILDGDTAALDLGAANVTICRCLELRVQAALKVGRLWEFGLSEIARCLAAVGPAHESEDLPDGKQ